MRVVRPILVGNEEHASRHASVRHDRGVVARSARHLKMRYAVIRRGLDEPIEKDCVGTCRLAYDDVVKDELHTVLFFDGGRLLKKEVVEGADRLHRKASHVEPKGNVARDD